MKLAIINSFAAFVAFSVLTVFAVSAVFAAFVAFANSAVFSVFVAFGVFVLYEVHLIQIHTPILFQKNLTSQNVESVLRDFNHHHVQRRSSVVCMLSVELVRGSEKMTKTAKATKTEKTAEFAFACLVSSELM